MELSSERLFGGCNLLYVLRLYIEVIEGRVLYIEVIYIYIYPPGLSDMRVMSLGNGSPGKAFNNVPSLTLC